MKGEVYFDGGSRGNPGPYGCAVVLYVDGAGYQSVRFLGEHGTVNEAEYEGLLLAMRLALEHRVTYLQIRGDSKLIVEQVLGGWKTKQPHLVPYLMQARELAKRFAKVEIKHVSREQNLLADALVTEMLDKQVGKKRGVAKVFSSA